MSVFKIHPQLLTDCHHLGRFSTCHILLHKNATLPWFILVPETDIEDLLDLPPETRNQIMDEAALISAFIKSRWGCSKINTAAIGNVVRQLHVHVVGRDPGDACWPRPVWGNLDVVVGYSDEELEEIVREIAEDEEGVCAELRAVNSCGAS